MDKLYTEFRFERSQSEFIFDMQTVGNVLLMKRNHSVAAKLRYAL